MSLSTLLLRPSPFTVFNAPPAHCSLQNILKQLILLIRQIHKLNIRPLTRLPDLLPRHVPLPILPAIQEIKAQQNHPTNTPQHQQIDLRVGIKRRVAEGLRTHEVCDRQHGEDNAADGVLLGRTQHVR